MKLSILVAAVVVMITLDAGFCQPWEWQNPWPQGTFLTSVAVVNPDTGWAVGINALVRTTDGGASWSTESWDCFPYPSTVVTPNGTGWISRCASVHRSTDAGATWEQMTNLPVVEYTGQISFPTDDCGWVLTMSDTVLHTTDGGQTWTVQTIYPHQWAEYSAFVDSLHGWIMCSACGALLSTSDGGLHWVIRGDDVAEGPMSFADTLHGWVACYTSILYTETGGLSWSVQYDDDTTYWRAITCRNADSCWAGGDGCILKTTDGGGTWSRSALDPCIGIYGLSFLDAGVGWAVGTGGAMSKTTDAGETWTSLSEGFYCNVTDADFVDSLHGWAVGDRGTILRTTNGGAEWQPQISGSDRDLYAVEFLGPSLGWIGGDDGLLLYTEDGGYTWNSQVYPTTRPIVDLAFADPLRGWAMGSTGPVLYTDDGGMTWVEQLPDNSMHHHRVSAVSADEAWLVATGGRCYHTTNAGQTWDTTFSGMGLEDLSFLDAAHGWAVQNVHNNYTVLSTGDSGWTWEPRYTAGTGVEIVDLYADDTHTIWVGASMFQEPYDEFYLHTTDGGVTWDSLAWSESYLADIASPDSNHTWLIGPGSGIRLLRTGGVSSTEEHPSPAVPAVCALSVFPNPFNAYTTLTLDLPQRGAIRVSVFDLLGREVKTVADGLFNEGRHFLRFDGTLLSSGLYFVRLETPARTITRKMILLK
jgi:photosystem II stability/assembly factor-like uncharacterized protein